MMSAPAARTSAGFIALTVAAVPTGMKAGVRISPRSMEMAPVRARPSVADTGLDGVFVAGDWLGGAGHLADAALATGEEAGRRAARHAAGDGRAHGQEGRLLAHG